MKIKNSKKKQQNPILKKLKTIKILKYVIFLVCVLILGLSLIWHEGLTKSINPNYFAESKFVLKENQVDVQNAYLKVHFIDVGCADSTLIELPDNKIVLIDCAGDNLDKSRSAEAMEVYLNNNIFNNRQKVIDYLVLTHADSDHIYGTFKILQNYKVLNIIRPKQLSLYEDKYISEANKYTEALNYSVNKSGEYEKCIKNIYDYLKVNKNTQMYFSSQGLNFNTTDYDFEFISPKLDAYDADNDYSSIIRLSYATLNFLFMADAGEIGENEILDLYRDDIGKVQSTFLKVGHHGSASSSSMAFLQAVQADYYIMSTRLGVYSNLPSSEVINKIKNIKPGAKILRTDVDGNILIEANTASDYCIKTSGGSFEFVRNNVFLQWYYVVICLGVMSYILVFSVKVKTYEQMLLDKRKKVLKQKEKMLEEARRLSRNV